MRDRPSPPDMKLGCGVAVGGAGVNVETAVGVAGSGVGFTAAAMFVGAVVGLAAGTVCPTAAGVGLSGAEEPQPAKVTSKKTTMSNFIVILSFSPCAGYRGSRTLGRL